MTLTAFLAAWLLHLAAAASPGPAILLAARTGLSQGFARAVPLSIGLGLGAVVWAAAALFGLALIFQIFPALFWSFRIAGGLFLLWIAYQMWSHARAPIEDLGAEKGSSGQALLMRGLLTQLANPKPAIFFGAVFAGTVPPGTSLPWLLTLLIMVFVNEVACNLGIARLFALQHTRAIYMRAKTGIDRTFAGILGCLGVKIALF